MGVLLFIVSACELRHFFKVVPLLDTDWAGVEPGNYGLDPFNMDTPERRMSELKNGRLQCLASAGSSRRPRSATRATGRENGLATASAGRGLPHSHTKGVGTRPGAA